MSLLHCGVAIPRTAHVLPQHHRHRGRIWYRDAKRREPFEMIWWPSSCDGVFTLLQRRKLHREPAVIGLSHVVELVIDDWLFRRDRYLFKAAVTLREAMLFHTVL